MLMATPSVHLQVPPPGRYGIEDLWKATVNSDTVCDAWFEGFVFEQTHGQVFHATTTRFRLARVTRVYGYRDVRIDQTQTAPGYEAFVTRSGGLPQGNYSFRLILRPFGVGGSFTFEVKPTGPPRLISPPDGAKLGGEYPNFVWTPPTPMPRGPVTYKLRLYEVLPGQTPDEAVKSNPPWFEQDGINSTRLSYPTGARKLDADKEYAWQVTAEGVGIQPLVSDRRAFKRAFHVPQGVPIEPLQVSRDIQRYGNYFLVQLTLKNVGSQNITNIVVADSHKYFQCLADAQKRRLPPPGGEQVPGWTTEVEPADCSVSSADEGFTGIIQANLGNWVLPPGLSISVSYSVLPLLTVVVMGPGHTIGSGLRVTYQMAGDQHARSYPQQAKTPVPGLADAWKAADYMILTCPSRVQGSEAEVEQLLVKTAELAKARAGALVYLTSAPATATIVRTICTVLGSAMKDNWQNGYLLLVGESDVIPAWSKPAPNADIPALDLSDYDYADWNDDLMPELRVGRMLGRNAVELRQAIQNALDYRKKGVGWPKPTTIFVSGPEPGRWLFVRDMATGRDTMASLWGNSTVTFHTDFLTTRRRIITHALYALGDGGGVYWGSKADTLGHYGLTLLSAWLLALKRITGVPVLDLLYPPKPGDTHFHDANGVQRRLPVGFGGPGVTTAVHQAEQTMVDARDGGTYGTYEYYPPENGDAAPAAILATFDVNTTNEDVIVWVGHSNPSWWGDVCGGWEVKNLHIATRPVVIAFGCHCGDYNDQNAVAREFLDRFASVYIGATASMYGFGDHMLATEWWHAWTPGMSISDGLQRLKLWNMQAAPGNPTDNILGVPWITYFVRIMNLYGDPKVGRAQ
jgi:hypothetical protein